MGKPLVIFQSKASYEPSYQVASTAAVACAMGDDVLIVLSFEALRAWAQGTWGTPANPIENEELSRAEKMGALPPQKMLEEARKLGARVVACDTVRKIALGDDVVPESIDEVMGLPSIWRQAELGRVLSF
jgi:peroxiredoxin family protein